jgi:hypothetical protein
MGGGRPAGLEVERVQDLLGDVLILRLSSDPK